MRWGVGGGGAMGGGGGGVYCVSGWAERQSNYASEIFS